MGKTINPNYLRNIQIASEFDKRQISYLYELIEKRRQISQKILRNCENDEQFRDMIKSYNFLNDQIRLYLGV